MTKYVTTRNYRAPELFLSYKSNYSKSVDIWSFGCILAEFFNKKVLISAQNDIEYLQALLILLGPPNEKMRKEINSKTMLNLMTEMQNNSKQKSLKEIIPEAPDDAIDLIGKCMTYDPSKRLSALEIIKHPFF